MVERVRVPLAVGTNPRNASSMDKDSLLQNLYIDKSKSGTVHVVKRPGYISVESPSVASVRGIFFNENEATFYYINSTNTPIEFT